MIEIGSWSMTFEEVSFLSLCVCNISVCLSEKCSILLPKVTNRAFPAVPLLRGQGGDRWGRLLSFCSNAVDRVRRSVIQTVRCEF